VIRSTLSEAHQAAVEAAIGGAERFEAGLVDLGEATAEALAAVAASTHGLVAAGIVLTYAVAAADFAAGAYHCAVGAAAAATAQAAAYAAAASVAASPDAQSAVTADYEFAAREAKARRWTDSTPVPCQLFGEMWPNGAPEWAT